MVLDTPANLLREVEGKLQGFKGFVGLSKTGSGLVMLVATPDVPLQRLVTWLADARRKHQDSIETPVVVDEHVPQRPVDHGEQ